MNKPATYLALGDSYTIGKEVSVENSFPYQLVDRLNHSGLVVGIPKIIATTGWTSSALQDAITKSNLNQKFDIVTLLIGVNNQYRGESSEIYRKEFKALLQTAIDFADGHKDHVFVLSIPDWGVTPYAINTGLDQQLIAQQIDAFNAIKKVESIALGVSYTNITTASRKAANDLELLAPDGLHYSAKMYAEWVEAMEPAVIEAMK